MINSPSELEAAPGDMTAVDTEDSEATVALESFGMFSAQLTTSDGDPLELTTAVDVWFPVYGSHESGDSIGLYSFNEDTGLWVNEGTGTIDDDRNFVASVSHFTWWNCDQPVTNTSCLQGVATADDGTPMTDGHVRAVGIDYMGGGYGDIGPDGTFCVDVKPESENTIKLVAQSDNVIWTGETTGSSGLAGIECDDEACIDVGTVELTEVTSGCLTGRVTGDVSSLDDVSWTYYAYDDFSTYSGSFEIEDDLTFCVTVPSNVHTTSFSISTREETGSYCWGWLSFSYWGESDTGILDTGSWDGRMELGERSCEDGDCLDAGELEVTCSGGGSDGDGGDRDPDEVPISDAPSP
jgi:hypothetical protein